MLQTNGGEIPSEAYLQRQARHRHVIDIYEVVDNGEHYVYVMERPEVCKDLFDVIHDRDSLGRPLTEREARRYFAQILQANINCEETGGKWESCLWICCHLKSQHLNIHVTLCAWHLEYHTSFNQVFLYLQTLSLFIFL